MKTMYPEKESGQVLSAGSSAPGIGDAPAMEKKTVEAAPCLSAQCTGAAAGKPACAGGCRRAAEADLPEIAALSAALFPDSAWDEAAFSDNLKKDCDHLIVWEQAQRIEGFVLLRALWDAELLLIGVSPHCRRQGAGRELLEAALSEVGERDVFLEVRDGNEAAKCLYAAFGFEEISRRRQYYKNPPEDAVIMKR